MATTAPSTEVSAKTAAFTGTGALSNPLALWHLLSLDAPTVAALWTWFFAAANHIRLPAASVVAMAFAVWVLYAADRLLDSRAVGEASSSFPFGLEERHFFHRSHRKRFRVAMVLACLALAFLLPRLPSSSMRLYGILGAMLFGYFLLIHLPGAVYRIPKELAVGVFFSAATFIPTISRQPSLRPVLLPAALLFAVLCSLNCLFIYAWEHPGGDGFAHPATQFALRFLTQISATAVALGTLMTTMSHIPWQLPTACSLSAALLLLLDRNRGRFAPSTLRASADLCLLTPLLLLFTLR